MTEPNNPAAQAERLRDALEKAADTFADLRKTLRLLGRHILADACAIAENATRDVLASDKPAAGPSSPSSASLESGGGTLDTRGAANREPTTPEGC